MTGEPNKLEAMADHELAVAERYRWWAVFLVREKRRLQGIADAVQAEAAAQGVETPEAMLTRLDAELALDAPAAAPAQLEDHAEAHQEEDPASEQAGDSDSEAAEAPPAEDDETLRRRLSGRAALLGGSFANDEEED